MKHVAYLLALVAATILAARVRAEEPRACKFAVKARCVSGNARVTLADGRVKRIEVEVFWCGLPGRPGYTCTIDSARGDSDSTWSDDAGATVIANKAPWSPTLPDRVKVTVGQDVSIDFEEAQSLGRCGAGAELPETIVIPAQKGVCRVRLPSP